MLNIEKEQEVIERLVVTEQRSRSNTYRIDEHDEEIKLLKDQSSTIYKLAVNQEVMNNTLNSIVEDSRNQMGAFTETLGNMNKNLTHMNSTQKEMSSEIQLMQKDITSTKNHVKDVEELANKNKDRGKFDTLNFLTIGAPKYVGLAIIAALLTYFGIK